jgi:hypothetical protein
MEHEAAPGLDRSAVMDRLVRRFAGLKPKLLQQPAQADPRPLVADADPNCSIVVMNAQRGDASFKAGIGHARHGKQQLSGKKGSVRHPLTMPPPARRTSLVDVTIGD